MRNCCIDERCALTAILQSISMQEAALAQILNSEAEKLQKATNISDCFNELLEVNESIRQTISAIHKLEETLKEKAVYAMEELKELREKSCC